MDSDFYESLRLEFKKRNISALASMTKRIMSECSNGFLRGEIRYHPLGFLFCRLYNFSNNESIRLHVWTDKANIQKPLMDIHNHFYHVNSFVVTGSVSNKIFSVSEIEPFTHSVYYGSYGNNEKRLLSNKNKYYSLSEIRNDVINAGELYEISKTEVHQGESLDNSLTITIVYTEEPGNPSPQVFGPLKGEKEYEYLSKLVELNNVIDLEKKIMCLTQPKKT